MLKHTVYLFAQSTSGVDLPQADFSSSLVNIVKIVMGVIALLSVLFVAIGGIRYTLSAGDPQNLAKAKNTIISALIGLAIAVSVFIIIGFVGSQF